MNRLHESRKNRQIIYAATNAIVSYRLVSVFFSECLSKDGLILITPRIFTETKLTRTVSGVAKSLQK